MKSFKIIIAGLDYAGKTSSIIALRQKYNFYEQVKNLKPTIKIEYNTFDFLNEYEINLWDMGGQAKYRKMYLDRPAYFEDTNYIYYYIDIQDIEKITTSIDYLKELLNIFRDLEYENEIIICIHKYDPKLRRDKIVLDRIRDIKNQLNSIPDFEFKFFRTSIFDIASLSKAISYSLNKLIDLKALDLALKSLMRKFNGNYAVLYTEDGVILVDSYREILDSMQYEQDIKENISHDLVLIQKLKDDNVDFSERVDYNDDVIEYLKKYDINGNSFFLKMNTPNLEEEGINLLKQNFKNFEKNIKEVI
ncbi:MAG: putative ARF-like protein [Promethearchaeota archaeon]|nr:MAG: putative ARF-like protein [Candidatus Lokiarchaeota archaeon]